MIIRKANLYDNVGLAKVQVDSYRRTYQDIFPVAYLDHFTYEEQERDWLTLLSEKRKDVLFVAATETNEIVGYALGTPNQDDVSPYECELVALHVRHEYQKQGLGKQLFAAVSSELERLGSKSLFLWVLADNPARSFYEKLGGLIISEKAWQNNGYFNTNIDEVAYGWLDIKSLGSYGKSVHTR